MCVKEIYIPLCFYYIYPSAINVRILINIYIPLCFYYIEAGQSLKEAFESIYIPLCFYYIQPARWDEGFGCRNLHSTMFLLHLFATVDSANA